MAANNTLLGDSTGVRFAPVLASLIFPGVGEFYYGESGRPLIIWFLRLFFPIFVPAYVYDTRLSAVPFFFAILLILLLIHIFSSFSAARLSARHSLFTGSVTRRLRSCVLYAVVQTITCALALLFFLSSVYPIKISKDALPSLHKGSFLLASVRSADMYQPGDLILCEGEYVRIISKGPSYVEYADGVFIVDGGRLSQNVPSSADLKRLGVVSSEEIYSEENNTIHYLVARKKKYDTPTVSFSLKKGEYLVCRDDRRTEEPKSISGRVFRGILGPVDISFLKKGL